MNACDMMKNQIQRESILNRKNRQTESMSAGFNGLFKINFVPYTLPVEFCLNF
jgi:hypothetical protein